MGSFYLEWLNPNKGKFPLKAKYYENPVDDPSEGGQTLYFDYVDPISKTYRTLFGNIISDRKNGEIAIRTNTGLSYHQASYIVFSNGTCYQIIQTAEDYSRVSKEALRLWKNPVGVEYVIRMVQVPNPWGVT